MGRRETSRPENRLGARYILFGEWLNDRLSVHYRGLPHYFFESDIYDKEVRAFLDLDRRITMLDDSGIRTVPVLHWGATNRERLLELIGRSQVDSHFENPLTNQADDVMEGLYLRTEAGGVVTGRAKVVRPEFVEKVTQSAHWQYQAMTWTSPRMAGAGLGV